MTLRSLASRSTRPLTKERRPWKMVAVLGAASVSLAHAAVTDLSGNPDPALHSLVPSGNSARLIGNTKFSWRATNNSIDVDLNGFQLTMDTGGGNGQTYNGAITGPGSLRLIGNSTASSEWPTDIRFGGPAANTPDSVTITQGRINLSKTAGADALSGPITVNVAGANTARMIWLADDQISDASSLTSTAGSGSFFMQLNGHEETIDALALKSGHVVETGVGGVLKVSSLTVGGTSMPRGAYTADSGFVTGSGYIDVDNFGPPVVTDPPAVPAGPVPAIGSELHPAFVTNLTWATSSGAASYDVFLWKDADPKPESPAVTDVVLSTFPLPFSLVGLTDYRWQVIARNAAGDTPGPEWTFRTADRRLVSGKLGIVLDAFVGSGPAELTADTTTHWGTTTSSADVHLNGFTFLIDTGGGNAQTYNGAITGPGMVAFQGNGAASYNPDMRLGGSTPNTMDGVELRKGRVVLNKTAGVNALTGPVNVKTVETVILQLTRNDQVDDASVVDSSTSTGMFTFAIGDSSDTIAGLSITSDHLVSTGSGVLTTGFLKINGTTMGAGTYTADTHDFVRGNGSVVVTEGGGSTFETWAIAAKGPEAAGFLDDADGDGVPNGLEFILGRESNPGLGEAGSRVRMPAAARMGDEFVFTFNRNREAAYLNPTVEFSPDLDEWTTAADPANARIEITPSTPGDMVRVAIPATGKDALFARLRATDTSIPGQPSPRITVPPQDLKVPDGESFTLTASAGGAKDLRWQWYFNGVAIEGATGSTLTVNGATPTAEGDYHVVATNASGNAISTSSHVRVTPVPGVNGLNLIPWPSEVQLGTGDFELNASARIVATDESLVDAANVLAGEISATHAIALSVVTEGATDGDIVLQLDAAYEGERYTVNVGDRAVIRGRDAFVVSMGTTTLLQSLHQENGTVLCTRVDIDDQPAVAIRAMHLDLARKDHSLESLLQAVDLCRLYKTNYLHLHFNDDQAYTFPSAAFPELNTVTQNRNRKVYTLQEMEELEAYAVARGVHIMPELEMPGHCNLMLVAYPDLFQIRYPVGGSVGYLPSSSINVAKPEVRAAVRTLMGEICAVFKSTPYIHIGCDEVDWAWSEYNPEFQAAFVEWGFNRPNPRDNVHLVFSKFIAIARDYAEEFGKKAIVWENGAMGSTPEVTMPTDILVMPFDSYGPGSFPAKGFKLVNAAWSPLYLVTNIRKPLELIYDWDLTIFGQYSGENPVYASHKVASEHVLGAQLTTFEQEEDLEMMSTRRRLAAMSERIWNPGLGIGFDNFVSRLDHTDALLDSLLSPVRITYSGLDNPIDRAFGSTATVTMSLTPEAAAGEPLTIRYTTNRTDVTSASTLYTGPIQVNSSGYFRAAAFNASGQRVGRMVREMHRNEMTAVANLASGKPVSANSGSNPANAVDLRTSEGWDTNVSTSRPDGESITVDLESVQSINRVAVLFGTSGSYAYRVEISGNATSWTNVGEATKAGDRIGVTHTFATTPARYVRVTLRAVSGSTGNRSVKEIMVTGD